MLKRDRVKLVSSILLAAAIMLVALPACGDPAEGARSMPVAVQTTDVTPAAATEPPAPAPDVSNDSGALIEQGKLLYEKAAGGVGCAFCHEMDAEGGGTAPFIVGADIFMVRDALKGVPAMSFFELDDEEIRAITAFLKHLTKQP